ncbi:MAG: hypothetical protein AAGC55_23190, partial [Myxococcota bacterium]
MAQKTAKKTRTSKARTAAGSAAKKKATGKKATSKKAKSTSRKTTAARASKPAAPLAEPSGSFSVSTVRGLAEVVEDHGLSELIIDTPEMTITLRRSAASETGQAV